MLDAVLKGPRSRVMPDDEMSRNVEHGKVSDQDAVTESTQILNIIGADSEMAW